MKQKIFHAMSGVMLLAATGGLAVAQTTDLFVDSKTQQIFAVPGPGRVKMGTAIITPGTQPPTRKAARPTPSEYLPPQKDSHGIPVNWYDRFTIRGYTQLRYTSLWDKSGADWYHPADRTVAPDQTFLIRRGRLVLSGDASDHLALYAQGELNGSPSDGDFAMQMRDLYGDISFDTDREYRIRVGQSKIPFGWVNLQSSQNRAPMERPDAINSAAEGERDIGTFFMWAPKETRERFANLVKSGLKGSGDYGVFALGAYSGQGANRSDANDQVHTIVRASYPWKTEGGQFFETGVNAYTGKFVPKTKGYKLNGSDTETVPTFDANGVTDQRIGFTTVVYPQPIGFEAEWNIGKSPTLSDDYLTIDSKYMQGGYIQANAKIDAPAVGTIFPFIRWQYFDGARKFGKNAPVDLVNEWDFGTEWSPWKDVEFSAMYTYTVDRTNTNSFPYGQLTNGSRLGLQVQINY